MKVSNQNMYFKRITNFFIISHGMPLIITLIVMLIGNSIIITNPLHGKLLYIGFISPTIAALFIVYKFYNKLERKDYWKRVIDFRRISWIWYLIIISFPILIRLLAAIIDVILTTNDFHFFISPSMTLSYALFLLPFGPIPEEVGWRGVVLPDLKESFGFNRAVIFLGFMWSIWHLPMFFVEGTYQNQLGLLTPLFWNFMFQAFFTSAICGVIYFETNQSILAAILFHYFGNLMGETFVMTFEAAIIETVLRGTVAIVCLIYFGTKINRRSVKALN